MARINSVIQRLIDKQTVFSTNPITNGAFDELVRLSKSQFDMVIIETEHQGYDSLLLKSSLQFLLNRKRIGEDGAVMRPAPFVRVPANTREKNEWTIKQILDAGVMGLVLPHLDSIDGAEAAVRNARYPLWRDSGQTGPAGLRGYNPSFAAHYWGLSTDEYYERADIWPLNPAGEILLMGIVENVVGVKMLPQILQSVKGIGAVWAGVGDLAASMGLKGHVFHPEVEKEVLNILKVCKDHGVACAVPAGLNGPEERIEQGFEIVFVHQPASTEMLDRGLVKAGRPTR